MQVKVVIGTIAFMLTMIVLGLATLLEPTALAEKSEAFEGRQIENGAQLFQNSCAECHGLEGKALNCVDAAGTEKACVGLPLNNTALLCGEPPRRLTQMGWTGALDAFIRQTISAGRPPTAMPTWSEEYGGPMGSHEIDQLTSFILNWSTDPALCGEEGAPAQVEWPALWEDLPAGDAENGAALYVSNACTSCHGDPQVPGTNGIGPHLGNIANVASTRVEGMSAEQYIYESIYSANSFIAPDCPTGPCAEQSAMAASAFENRLSQQDMADLIAYYMTLTNE